MKSTKGQQLQNHQIVISNLPTEVLDQIDDLAHATDRSRAAMSRVLLATALAAQGVKATASPPAAPAANCNLPEINPSSPDTCPTPNLSQR